MQNIYVRYVVYSLFFLLCLAYFTVMGFPLHLVQGRMEREIERNLGMRMTTGQMEIMFPNGVEASNVRLMQEGKEGRPGLAILISRAKARLSLLGLISGNKDISFTAELLNGKVEGDLSLQPDRQEIDARLSSVDLGRLPVWQDLLGLPLAGKITGKLDLTLMLKNTKSGGKTIDVKASKGNVELALEQGALGEGSIRGLTTPPISLGKTQATLEITQGKAEIKSFQVRSDDIEASLDGYFYIKQKLNQASAHCNLRFRPSVDFLNKNPKFKDIISLSGMNRAKNNEGFFAYQVYGRVTHPQFRPSR